MSKSQLDIPRDRAARLGHEAVAICERGQYVAPSGAIVNIRDAVARAVAGTVSYPPDVAPAHVSPAHVSPAHVSPAHVSPAHVSPAHVSPAHVSPAHVSPAAGSGAARCTRFEVANETTLSAAKRLLAEGYRVAALNFASAKNPGGGFLKGARAQEEYLCRSSALYACLRDNPMYPFHRKLGGAWYSDYVLYSPDVPVFRDDDGALLETPYAVSFLTSPAVNAKFVPRERLADIPAGMRARVVKVLACAAAHGHDALVLGAWGCGAFGNDGDVIAPLFRQALDGDFAGVFAKVIFAVTDWSPEGRYIGPFLRAFA